VTGLIRDPLDGDRAIRWVNDDAIGVGSRIMRTSFVLSEADGIVEWPVASMDALSPELIAGLLDRGPDVILLGTGTVQRPLAPALLYRALARGVGVEVMTNAAAARTYNLLLTEQRRVLAAFILSGPVGTPDAGNDRG
jgi:uncharacterized protein